MKLVSQIIKNTIMFSNRLLKLYCLLTFLIFQLPAFPATLTVGKSTQPSTLNLATEGSSDWSHWGLNAATDWNHKSGVASPISNITRIGTGAVSRYTDGTMTVSWTGGTPAASASSTRSGIYVAGLNNGFQINVPADATSRLLKVYCGVWKSQGRLEASLSDGSAPAIVDTSHGSTTGSANTTFSINYAAGSAGQTLTVRWTVQTSQDTSGAGTVGWQAATLATAAPVDPCAGNTPPTANITSPASGSSYTAPASVTINASATDAGGSVTSVEFFQGSSLLGTDLASPYSLNWSNVGAGSYSLTARATDNCNATATSSAVSITVNSSSSTSSSGTPTTTTLNPVADTYVRDGIYASSVFGSSSVLQSKLGALDFTRIVYLKFDISGASGTISSAKLRLYGKYSSTSGATATHAYPVSDDAWSESVLNWNNKPATGTASQANVLISSQSAQYYEWDITSYVASEKTAGQSLVSVALKHDASCSGNNDFNSREASSNKPQLVIVSNGGGPIDPCAGNSAPSVSITSPLSGSTYTAPASIALAASAADSGGSVSKVEFFSGTSLVATDSNSPYGATWSSVAAGSYSLSAKATDNCGAVTTSSAVSVTVNSSSSSSSPAPAWKNQDVGFVAAAGSLSISGSTFKVTGSGRDIWSTSDEFHYAYKQLNGNGEIVARVTAISTNLPNAKAGIMIRDSLNRFGRHAMVNLTPDGQLQNIFRLETSAESDNQGLGSGKSAPYWLRLVRNGDTITSYTSTTGTSWTTGTNMTFRSLPVSLHMGLSVCSKIDGTLMTVTYDNVSTSSQYLEPSASITSPAMNSYHVTGSSIDIAAVANDPDGFVSKVSFYNGSTILGTDTMAPFSVHWANVGIGTYTLSAKATDNVGATGSSSPVTITVNCSSCQNNRAPTITLTSPSSGATYTEVASIPLSANVSDPEDGSGAQKVEFFVNNVWIGTDTTSPFTLTWTKVGSGGYSLSAKVTDSASVSTVSSSASVTVNSVSDGKIYTDSSGQIRIWIPNGISVLRGGVYNPFSTDTVTRKDYHDVAKIWQFAVLSSGDNPNATTLQAALKGFAAASGHPEVEHFPLILVSFSAGTGTSIQIAKAMPSRIIAIGGGGLACSCLASDTPDALRRIPIMMFFGEKDGDQPENVTRNFLLSNRKLGALWSVAMQWGEAHCWCNGTSLIWPFFDQCIALRIPAGATAVNGPITLNSLSESSGWLGDHTSWDGRWARIDSYASYTGDKSAACWFPNKYMAYTWRGWVSKYPPVGITLPRFASKIPTGSTVLVAAEDFGHPDVQSLEILDGDVVLASGLTNPSSLFYPNFPKGVRSLLVNSTFGDNQKAAGKPYMVIGGSYYAH